MSTHPSSLRSLWLPALIGICWLGVCYYLILVFTAPDPTPDRSPPEAQPAGSVDEGPAEPTGSTRRARLEIRDTQADRTTGWIDVVVTGDEAEAQAACEVLTRLEQGRTYPIPLAVQTERSCSPEALPLHPADVKDAFGLFQPSPLAWLDVVLAGGRQGESLTDLRTVTVGAFADRKGCEKALATLTASRADAEKRARLIVVAFLDEQATSLQKQAEQACRTGGSERECATIRALQKGVENRRKDPQPLSSDELGSPTCRSLVER